MCMNLFKIIINIDFIIVLIIIIIIVVIKKNYLN